MSIKHARWALEVYVERIECDLEDEGMSRHERALWESRLTDAREGLKELATLERAARLYMRGYETANEARNLLATIARECQTPVAESGEEGR